MKMVQCVAGAALLLGVAGVGQSEQVSGTPAASGQNATQPVADGTVTANVTGQFAKDDALKHADIDVTTSNGVVTLKGSVPSEAAHQHALEMARSSTGVKGVDDNLRIAVPRPMPLGTVPP